MSCREFMVAILAPIGETFLQPCCQLHPLATLGLCQPPCRLFQFTGMRNLLATRQREQMPEAWVDASLSIPSGRDRLGSGIDKEAQIPARGTRDQPCSLDPTLWQWLCVKAYPSYPWDSDGIAQRSLERIGKGILVSWLRCPLSLGRLASFLRHRSHAV